MSMSIVMGRHGLSEANNEKNVGTMAFAHEQASLMGLGREQAQTMGGLLVVQFNIDPASDSVAVSEMRRTEETAEEAGFKSITRYSSLDEIRHGMDLLELRAMLDEGKLPPVAIRMAEETLSSPPKERVWISHGLRIAGICAVLGIHQEKRLIPRFCETREIPDGIL